MSEILDERIRRAIVNLVETSPPPIPYATVASRRRRGTAPLTLSSGLTRMAISAGVVLLAGAILVWLAQGTAPLGPSAPSTTVTTADLPAGAVPIPAELADDLLDEDGLMPESMVGVQQAADLPAGYCATSGWQVCVVPYGEVALILPYTVPDGATALVSVPGSFLGAIELPFRTRRPLAVAYESGAISIEILEDGVTIGEMYAADLRREEP